MDLKSSCYSRKSSKKKKKTTEFFPRKSTKVYSRVFERKKLIFYGALKKNSLLVHVDSSCSSNRSIFFLGFSPAFHLSVIRFFTKNPCNQKLIQVFTPVNTTVIFPIVPTQIYIEIMSNGSRENSAEYYRDIRLFFFDYFI